MLIEHDMQAVMGLCEMITVMNFGTRLAEGTPAEVRANPAVVEAYLGSAFDAA
jgi:branched-chain amino acid transport system ATP-binding protein